MEEAKDLNYLGPNTDMIEIMKDYVENMIKCCSERKALILDDSTLSFVSLIYSRSNLLEKNVYFFDTIDRKGEEKLKHLAAIFFVRNTPENCKKIEDELKNPLFNKYYLFFANPIDDFKLKEFAEADKHNLVLKVIEMFADFNVINKDLFSFNITSSMDLIMDPARWGLETSGKCNRIIQGLFSVILS